MKLKAQNEKLFELRTKFQPIILSGGRGKELFFGEELVQNENGIVISEGDNFINATYGAKGLSKMLSNLFPYEIHFKGHAAKSLEGIFQGIKHKEPEVQKVIMQYFGMDALYTREANKINDWRESQTLYFGNQSMLRGSEQYQQFIDELYTAALQNPLYAKAVRCAGNKTILHSIGKDDPKQTVLTRNEFESRLNSIKEL